MIIKIQILVLVLCLGTTENLAKSAKNKNNELCSKNYKKEKLDKMFLKGELLLIKDVYQNFQFKRKMKKEDIDTYTLCAIQSFAKNNTLNKLTKYMKKQPLKKICKKFPSTQDSFELTDMIHAVRLNINLFFVIVIKISFQVLNHALFRSELYVCLIMENIDSWQKEINNSKAFYKLNGETESDTKSTSNKIMPANLQFLYFYTFCLINLGLISIF